MFNSATSIRDPGSAAADVLRTYWDQYLPIRVDLIAQLMGVGVFARPMNYSGHFVEANYEGNSTGMPAILVNTNDPVPRQRFTIAHELGHFVLGHGTSPRDTSQVLASSHPKERAANQFAAHLLMPTDAIRMMISQGHTSTQELAGIFGVSTAAMGYHLVNLGLR